MGYYANTVDSDFRIPAEKVPAALAAVNAALSVVNAGLGGQFYSTASDGGHSTLADAVEEMTSFEGCEEGGSEDFILGGHCDKYLSRTEKLLAILAAFATDGSYVRFHGEDDSLFGFRVIDGRLRAESGDYTWSLDPLPAADGQVVS
ncbi:MAG: hypothetical protein K0U84_05075 [Actinomycetia bacterium]|nr:hypothetical protein [Actinomycetes bacterium]